MAPAGTRFVVPVTQLETYVQCLRRGMLVHHVGAREDNLASRARAEALDADDPLDPLARGRLAHAVLAALDRFAEHADAASFISGVQLPVDGGWLTR